MTHQISRVIRHPKINNNLNIFMPKCAKTLVMKVNYVRKQYNIYYKICGPSNYIHKKSNQFPVKLGIPVFVTFDIIPLIAKDVITNHPQRNT